MIFHEKTIRSEKKYNGRVLNLRVDTIKTFDGGESTREIIEHPGAVAIIAITSDDKIVMVRQYRKPVEEALLEIPAGKIEKNEEHSKTAKRELKEETGYEARHIELLFSYYSSPGVSDEKIYLYIARELTSGETDFDDNEHIETEEYSIDDLLKMISSGEIKDGKTIIGIQTALRLT